MGALSRRRLLSRHKPIIGAQSHGPLLPAYLVPKLWMSIRRKTPARSAFPTHLEVHRATTLAVQRNAVNAWGPASVERSSRHVASRAGGFLPNKDAPASWEIRAKW